MTMFMMLGINDETLAIEEGAVIDQSGALKPFLGGGVGKQPNVNERQVGIALPHEVVLIDYTIGGAPAPGTINANFGTGQKSLNHTQAHSRAGVTPVASPMYNPVIGNVGTTSRAQRQYNGVLGQISNYDQPTIVGAAAFVGIKLTPTVQP